jgi:hypothetical protein
MAYEAKLIVADLDGTLSMSKTPIDPEMASLICQLLKHKDLAVISGGSYSQFQHQFISTLNKYSKNLQNLYLFPTCATSMYIMKNNGWEKVYGYEIGADTKKKIFEAFGKALSEYGFNKPSKIYGELIEDRGTQVTFSAYGQLAPLELKSTWDPDCKKRLGIISYLKKYLPEDLEAKVGGTTSIDVTKKGIDKAYGIRKIEENLKYKTGEMLFLGDKLDEGGNDYPVKSTGVKCIKVDGPEETKKIIREIISAAE